MKHALKCLISLVLISFTTQAAELNCQTCHGSQLQGNPALAAPALNILSGEYVKAQLMAFKQDWRANSAEDQAGLDMRAVAQLLSPNDIEAAITLVTKLALKLPSNALSNAAAPASWQSCIACHGAQGQGNASLQAPALIGQQAAYLAKQLWDYQQGHRGIKPADANGQMMRQIAQTLQAEEIIQLSQFLAQKPKMEKQ